MDDQLVMDMIDKGEMTKEELKAFLDSTVVYRLDRKKIRTIDNMLDVFEHLIGNITLEKGKPEELFLQNSIAKYYTKVEYESEDTDESDSQSKP